MENVMGQPPLSAIRCIFLLQKNPEAWVFSGSWTLPGFTFAGTL